MPTKTTLRSAVRGHGSEDHDFDRQVRAETGTALAGLSLDTVQVNVGLGCNLACRHCHVVSSPARNEAMDWPTMERVLDVARRAGARTLDVTGGAPEMHPCFRRFVSAARQQGLEVIVRTNLVILLEDGFEDLPAWFAAHGIRLAASLPCYLETNVDRQRGRRVHARSIEALRRLNAVGYGSDAGPFLDLVYNPVGPTLPPDQTALERAYRQELHRGFGIRFNRLYTLTNLPIGRFLQDLERRDRAEAYAEVLRTSFNPRTIDGLMCRHQVHVGWDGTLHDCDFNFALGLEATVPRPNVHDFDPATFVRRRIRTGSHCFGCTAGCGSSCNGALA